MHYVAAALFGLFIIVVFGLILNPPSQWLAKAAGDPIEPNEPAPRVRI